MLSAQTARRMVARNMRLVPEAPGTSLKPVAFACDERPLRCHRCHPSVECKYGQEAIQGSFFHEDSEDIPYGESHPYEDPPEAA